MVPLRLRVVPHHYSEAKQFPSLFLQKQEWSCMPTHTHPLEYGLDTFLVEEVLRWTFQAGNIPPFFTNARTHTHIPINDLSFCSDNMFGCSATYISVHIIPHYRNRHGIHLQCEWMNELVSLNFIILLVYLLKITCGHTADYFLEIFESVLIKLN